MNKALALVIAAVMAGGFFARALADEDLPDGMKGFRGTMRGKLLGKNEDIFVLKVEKILNVAKESRATDPQSAVGKEVNITIDAESKRGQEFIKVLAGIKIGETMDVEVVNNDLMNLTVLDVLKKVETDTKPTDTKPADTKPAEGAK